MQLNIMSKKEVKRLSGLFLKNWGIAKVPDLVYMINKKGRIYAINKEAFDIDHSKLRVD